MGKAEKAHVRSRMGNRNQEGIRRKGGKLQGEASVQGRTTWEDTTSSDPELVCFS